MMAKTLTAKDYAYLLDLTRVLVEVRALDEQARDAVQRFGWPQTRSLANTLRSEIETRHRAITHTVEAVLLDRGLDPGRTAEDASRLVRKLTEAYYAAPDEKAR